MLGWLRISLVSIIVQCYQLEINLNLSSIKPDHAWVFVFVFGRVSAIYPCNMFVLSLRFSDGHI